MVPQPDRVRTLHKATFPKRGFSHSGDVQLRMFTTYVASPAAEQRGEGPAPTERGCLLAICYLSQVCLTLFSDDPSGTLCSGHLNIRMKIVGFAQSASYQVRFFPGVEGVSLYLEVSFHDTRESSVEGPWAALSQVLCDTAEQEGGFWFLWIR